MGFVYDIYIYIYIYIYDHSSFMYVNISTSPSTTVVTKPPYMILGVTVLSTRQRKLRCFSRIPKIV